MLTIFSCPKPFTDPHINIIQRNAIKSWTLLEPRPEIILVGDEEGTAEVCKEFGLKHIKEVEKNEYGTPLVNSIVEKAENITSFNIMCYVNADIILMSDFLPAIQRVLSLKEMLFLIVGRKMQCAIKEFLDFKGSYWESDLKALLKTSGKYVTYDFDFFLFPKGVFKNIPPFAIGRCFWTQWFIYTARKKGIPVIDVTPVVLSVESRHDYSHAISTGGAKRLSGVEYRLNRKLFKGCKYFTALNATHILTNAGVKKSPFINHILSLWVRFEYYIYFLLKGTLYPYSIPLILIGRLVRQGFGVVYSILRRFAVLFSK